MGTINRNSVAFFDKWATHEVRIIDYTGPNPYATGGDSLTPGSVALGKIDILADLNISNGSALLWGYYNKTTQKILWYSATGTQVPNGTDLSGYTGQFIAVGK